MGHGLPFRRVVCAVAVLSASLLEAASGPQLLGQLKEAIAKVQEKNWPTSGLSSARAAAAEQLVEVTSKIAPGEVDDQTLVNLVGLLDTWDDSVRVPVAAALGNLGPRARVAAPKLLVLLAEVDCVQVDLPPAPVIRSALRRIGATPPPVPTCDTKIDSSFAEERDNGRDHEAAHEGVLGGSDRRLRRAK